MVDFMQCVLPVCSGHPAAILHSFKWVVVTAVVDVTHRKTRYVVMRKTGFTLSTQILMRYSHSYLQDITDRVLNDIALAQVMLSPSQLA
jgi:hypothetical protein